VKTFRQAIEGYRLQLTDPAAYLQRMEQRLGRSLTEQERKIRLAEDPEVLIATFKSFLDWPPLTDQQLAGISAPCLVLCGELDEGGFHAGARESVSHIPRAEFVSFPGLGHVQTNRASDLVLPHIKEFLAGVSKT